VCSSGSGLVYRIGVRPFQLDSTQGKHLPCLVSSFNFGAPQILLPNYTICDCRACSCSACNSTPG
jgi:hypothetical protein